MLLKISPSIATCTLGAKLSPVENHRYKGNVEEGTDTKSFQKTEEGLIVFIA